MNAPLNVLVMSAGSIPGVAVIDALKGQTEIPVRVVAADMGSLSAGFLIADARHRVPAASDPDFISHVLEICRAEKIKVIFPIIDEELQVFADHAETFAREGMRVITNPPETVRVAKDKVLTSRRCAELGVLAPPMVLKEELGSKPLPPFPLILKPRDGRGSVGVQMVRNRPEFDFFVNYLQSPVIQQFIAGTEYTLDILTDFEGNLLSVVPKERIIVKSGMQTKGRTVKDQALMDYGADIARKFRLFPRGNVQCIRDRDGKIWLVEINPKFAASLPFTVEAGVNAPLIFLQLHLGRRVAPRMGQFKDGLVMLRVWRELYTQG